MGIGMSCVHYLKAGLSALSIMRMATTRMARARMVAILLPLALVACQSGPGSQGGLPGLIERVVPGSGAPQRVAPSPGAPAQTQQTNVTPNGAPVPAQQPAPLPAAAPSLAIETLPLQPPALRNPGSADAIRVGFLAPLSGPNAALGRALFEAAQLALFDLADNRLMLLPRDTEGTPEKAAAAASQVIAEGAQVIIGPLFANETAAVGGIARLRNIKVLSFSTDRSVAGNGVFLKQASGFGTIAEGVARATEALLRKETDAAGAQKILVDYVKETLGDDMVK